MKKYLNVLGMGAAVLSAAFLLSACGGGGSGSGDTTNPDTSSSSSSSSSSGGQQVGTSEFLGTWKDAKYPGTDCSGSFEYNNALYVKTLTWDVTETAMTLTYEIYDDPVCTTKLGELKMNFSLAFSPASAAGRDNVMSLDSQYQGLTLSHEPGQGLSLTSIPSGGSYAGKSLADIEGTNWFSTAGGTNVNAQGYPTDWQGTPAATR